MELQCVVKFREAIAWSNGTGTGTGSTAIQPKSTAVNERITQKLSSRRLFE